MTPRLDPARARSTLLPAPSGLFGLALTALLILIRGPKLLADGDTYTHIFYGNWILENLRLPDTDFLSHTVQGTSWVIHEWGAQVLMGAVYQFAGLPGIAVLFATLAGLTLLTLYRLLEDLETDPWLALALMTVTLLLLYPTMLARPHLFSWLFGSLTLLILTTRRNWLWVLPLLTVVWVNLHGGYILCLALQAIYLAGGLLTDCAETDWRSALHRQQQPLLILLLSLLATGLNPHGYALIGFYIEVSALDVTRHNPEWQAPDLQAHKILRVWLTLLLFALLVKRQRPHWTNLLLLLFCLEAALTHRRHVSLIAMLLLPLWRELLQPIQDRIATWRAQTDQRKQLICSGRTGPVMTLMLAAGLMLTANALPPTWQPHLQQMFPESELLPKKAWDYLVDNPPTGRVFNAYSWGAGLIYWSKGELPVFIDGLTHKYGKQVYEDYYQIAGLSEKAKELLDRYEIDWVLFPTAAPLTRYLLLTDEWQAIYRDDQASVLVRSAPRGR
ncbi:MAG: hypothetical protein RQ723_11430 [Desulfuromonadales bacterium]|nr:hypothetical protein [Desulfuromonadales bacterium]